MLGNILTRTVVLRQANMRLALEAFLQCNPSCATDTKVIVVDKDFGEIAVVREVLPDVRVLLCQFHAIAHVNKLVSKRFCFVRDSRFVTLTDGFEKLLWNSEGVRFHSTAERHDEKSVQGSCVLEQSEGLPRHDGLHSPQLEGQQRTSILRLPHEELGQLRRHVGKIQAFRCPALGEQHQQPPRGFVGRVEAKPERPHAFG